MITWWFDSLLMILMVMAPIVFIASIPAFYLLYKRNAITYFDYFLIVYVVILWTLLQSYAKPLFGVYTLVDLFVQGTILILVCVGIQYVRLFFPQHISKYILSFFSILSCMFITIILFYLTPSFIGVN